MVLVLKTSVGQLTAGSNPALSARKCLICFYKNEITLAAGGAITASSSTAATNTAT